MFFIYLFIFDFFLFFPSLFLFSFHIFFLCCPSVVRFICFIFISLRCIPPGIQSLYTHEVFINIPSILQQTLLMTFSMQQAFQHAHPLGNSRTNPAVVSRKNVVIHNCDFHRFRFTYSYFVAADGHQEITACMNKHMSNFKCSWKATSVSKLCFQPVCKLSPVEVEAVVPTEARVPLNCFVTTN